MDTLPSLAQNSRGFIDSRKMALAGLDRTNPEQNGIYIEHRSHLGMRFRCRYGVRGGRKEGAVPRWRADFQKTVGAARASPSLIGGLCPAAILSAAPRMQTTLLVGWRPKRDSFGVDFQGGAQESPRTSFSVLKKKKKT